MEPIYLAALPAVLAFCALCQPAEVQLDPVAPDTLLALVPTGTPTRLAICPADPVDAGLLGAPVGHVTLRRPLDLAALELARREARLAADEVREALTFLQPSLA